MVWFQDASNHFLDHNNIYIIFILLYKNLFEQMVENGWLNAIFVTNFKYDLVISSSHCPQLYIFSINTKIFFRPSLYLIYYFYSDSAE